MDQYIPIKQYRASYILLYLVNYDIYSSDCLKSAHIDKD
jgi:hypothetical protein